MLQIYTRQLFYLYHQGKQAIYSACLTNCWPKVTWHCPAPIAPDPIQTLRLQPCPLTDSSACYCHTEGYLWTYLKDGGVEMEWWGATQWQIQLLNDLSCCRWSAAVGASGKCNHRWSLTSTRWFTLGRVLMNCLWVTQKVLMSILRIAKESHCGYIHALP